MEQWVIHALSPERLDDFLAYFDHDAFTDGNENWSGCYCYMYHSAAKTSEAWAEGCLGGGNRAGAAELIRTGQMHGYLAYVGGKVVGWCHAAPRRSLPNLAWVLNQPLEAAEAVGSIVCYNIAGPYRRQGFAGRLLAAACAGFARQGLAFAEAYPNKQPASARHYHGPLALYERAGFTRGGELERYWVMRKALARLD